jgi:hypothetical protein
VAAALRILKQLAVVLHPLKTRIVHVQHGFELLGYKIKRRKALRLPASKIRSRVSSGDAGIEEAPSVPIAKVG